MRDSKADHYRQRTAECLRLAGLTDDVGLRSDYAHLAECYTELAEAAPKGDDIARQPSEQGFEPVSVDEEMSRSGHLARWEDSSVLQDPTVAKRGVPPGTVQRCEECSFIFPAKEGADWLRYSRATPPEGPETA